jgi:hypothetical protein
MSAIGLDHGPFVLWACILDSHAKNRSHTAIDICWLILNFEPDLAIQEDQVVQPYEIPTIYIVCNSALLPILMLESHCPLETTMVPKHVTLDMIA